MDVHGISCCLNDCDAGERMGDERVWHAGNLFGGIGAFHQRIGTWLY